ncbi:Hsp70 family protein [Paraburkholderia sp. JHI869]|uniref:Hsp70 family protein n=1 Tax=Paraburkholderia sp. JHI869 TaxID=3112959 RepID=UPI003173B938
MSFCAIDFGTSNSAVAVATSTGMRLANVEDGHTTLPTAVFFNVDDQSRAYGRRAISAYVDGFDGRLMRSIKSILGSPLAEARTDTGNGSAVSYLDVVALFLSYLKRHAEREADRPLGHAVLGRPVFFVDDNPRADALAQRQLEEAARSVGFDDIHFQYEPIAAAFDYESRLNAEALVLVADIGGGTSDFSLVRVGPERLMRLERKDDVLAHHGVHVAGTDFDRRIELASIFPEFGYRTVDTEGREIPNRIYYDLATWHLINTTYTPRRTAELKLLRHLYRDERHHARLMRVVTHRLGHLLAARAETAKIAVANGGETVIELDRVEPELEFPFDDTDLIEAGSGERDQIVAAARETARLAGVTPSDVTAVFFTGGSTGLSFLTDAIATQFPGAQRVFGDRLASVATGLGIHAQRLFAPAQLEKR